MQYEIHPVSRKYTVMPKSFKYKGHWSDHEDDVEYLSEIDSLSNREKLTDESWDKLTNYVISIMESKYPNFEDVFDSYIGNINSYSSVSRLKNLADKLKDFLAYGFFITMVI